MKKLLSIILVTFFAATQIVSALPNTIYKPEDYVGLTSIKTTAPIYATQQLIAKTPFTQLAPGTIIHVNAVFGYNCLIKFKKTHQSKTYKAGYLRCSHLNKNEVDLASK